MLIGLCKMHKESHLYLSARGYLGEGHKQSLFFLQEESSHTHTHNAFGLLADAWNMTLGLHGDVRELGNKN